MKLNQNRAATGALMCAALMVVAFASHSTVIGVIGLFGLLVIGVSISMASKSSALRAASSGTTRVEAVKAREVNFTVKQYAAEGWEVVSQSTGKSFGSQARVTITFRKQQDGQSAVSYTVHCPYCNRVLTAPVGLVRCTNCRGKVTVSPSS